MNPGVGYSPGEERASERIFFSQKTPYPFMGSTAIVYLNKVVDPMILAGAHEGRPHEVREQ